MQKVGQHSDVQRADEGREPEQFPNVPACMVSEFVGEHHLDFLMLKGVQERVREIHAPR